MARQSVDGLADTGIPDYCCLVEGASQDFIAVGVEMQGYELSIVTLQSGVDFAHLHIPEFGSAVHGTSSQQYTVRVKGYGYDFSFVAGICS